MSKKLFINLTVFAFFAVIFGFLTVDYASAQNLNGITVTVKVNANALGFRIPTLGDILTFLIRGFFVIAGLMALLYLMLGALAWVTSSGEKEGVEKARNKIQAAIVGMILIVAVLAVIWTLEQVVFAGKICFGISCPATVPALVKP
jgi:hypothetical protein